MIILGLLKLRPICTQLRSSIKTNKWILNKYVDIQSRTVLLRSNFTSEVSESILNTKTVFEKDKLLYYYENPRYYKIMNIFAIVQFLFWAQMAEFFHNKAQDVYPTQVSADAPWWRKLDFKDEKTKKLTAAFCFMFGYGILSTVWVLTLRSVRMLVLRKGGKVLSVVTYGPFGFNRTTEVPLEKISARVSRTHALAQLPLKVQGKWLHFILDMKSGTFKDTQLFDLTAGMHRSFKK